LVVRYDGDQIYRPHVRPAQLTIDINQPSASLRLSSTPEPATVGSVVALHASLQGNTGPQGTPAPTGVVRFEDDAGQLLCQASAVALDAHTATATCAATLGGAARQQTVLARYSGDAVYQGGSTNMALTLVPVERRWSGEYTLHTVVSPAGLQAPFGFAYENPVNAIGPVAGAIRGFFHFDDDAQHIIFGAQTVPTSRQPEQLRNSLPLVWRAASDKVVIRLPITRNGQSWDRVTTFEVTSRTATTLTGTVTVQSRAGVIDTVQTNTATPVPFTVVGSFSAKLVYSKLPALDMRGYDFCFADNVAAPMTAPGSWSWAGGFVSNGCDFGGP
jgi:hypothetical protein